ncbi:Organellar oligopeptidase A, chloroplastic/mitochondrial [Vitis vinifera]|uniref:Organellar oligopeptidase A, chloroplastic/mitochondrial n=1 Tax=Vitis vinifera TaxID=29760 RepID=A0A438KFU3_VITVI|nr:Organellar oligopeptidase A, chloroplastic/mitochondrial [Vitis vinifera]
MVESLLRYASVDLELHTKYIPDGSETIYDIDQRVGRRTNVIPLLPEDKFLCSFSHIFADKYAAGYYSYQAHFGMVIMLLECGQKMHWAEVLSYDAFSAFEEAGLDNVKLRIDEVVTQQAVKELGHKFRETVLAVGGGKSPEQVFVEFRGREPSPKALLRYTGLSPVTAEA